MPDTEPQTPEKKTAPTAAPRRRLPRVGITQGDVNGVGPEVVLKAISDPHISEICTPVVYGTPRVLSWYRKALQIAGQQLKAVDNASEARDGEPSLIAIDTPAELQAEPGKASAAAGEGAFAALERAVADLRAGHIDALVTAPIDKHSIQSSTFTFPGHTEYLEASLADPDNDSEKALMVMCCGALRLALVTTHLPMARVAAAITRQSVKQKIALFDRSLRRDFAVHSPRIAVLALNPHAGDSGLLGSEETEAIAPAIADCRAEGVLCFGPYPADGFFAQGQWRTFDGVLAMYHDQGLAPFKTLAANGGVNFTAGLAHVRTSPDHGTAYDIAGRGEADETSLREAIYAAIDIQQHRQAWERDNRNPLRRVYVERNKADNVVLDLSKDQ